MAGLYECANCQKIFNYKSSLRRHITVAHRIDEQKFECRTCYKTFGYKSSLLRHTATHSINEQKLECHTCQQTFRYKRDRCITNTHRENEQKFECRTCCKTFGYKSSLLRHTATHRINEQKFECHTCQKTFRYKHDLQRHITNTHRINEQRFECHTCQKTFGLKFNLRRHITMHCKDKHRKKSKAFECAHCSCKVERKIQLIKHIRLHHSSKNKINREPEWKCLKCGIVFLRMAELNKHYQEQHDIVLQIDEFQFISFEKFEEWLYNEQRRTITQFKKSYRYETLTSLKIRFKCIRSKGHYRNIPHVNDRKRCLKVSGYKGLEGCCPAEINVTKFNDGTCNVKYQKTHVGHRIGDKKELKYIYLSKSEKLDIAAKIQSGIPRTLILKQQCLSSTEAERNDRLSLLESQDLHNIAAKYNMDFQNREPLSISSDPIDTEVIIDQHRDDILFYKRRGEIDNTFDILEEEDFVVIIMNKEQEDYLRKYGHNVVAMDRTHNTKRYEFILHTILVLDIDQEGMPAAFLISNRNDGIVIDIFLSCIHRRIGAIETRTLITDIQITYYNSWIKVMGKPENFLYCTWHVHQAWLRNYLKVKNKEKRANIKRKVLDLAKEENPIRFEEKLASLISIEDEDTESFIQYFKQHFAHDVHRWAYCYRQSAGINTNMHLERFHGIFERGIARGQQIKSISQCLAYIFEYLAVKHADIYKKEIKGKVTSKLRMLRKRHRTAFECYKKGEQINVTSIDDETYLVDSFKEKNVTYTIYRNERKACSSTEYACRLLCDWCGICYHEFRCKCHDNAIKNNMCQHIHWLGLYLERNRSCVLENPVNLTDADPVNHLGDLVNSANSVNSADSVNNAAKTSSDETKHLKEFNDYITEVMAGRSPEDFKAVYSKYLVPIRSFLNVTRR